MNDERLYFASQVRPLVTNEELDFFLQPCKLFSPGYACQGSHIKNADRCKIDRWQNSGNIGVIGWEISTRLQNKSVYDRNIVIEAV